MERGARKVKVETMEAEDHRWWRSQPAKERQPEMAKMLGSQRMVKETRHREGRKVDRRLEHTVMQLDSRGTHRSDDEHDEKVSSVASAA